MPKFKRSEERTMQTDTFIKKTVKLVDSTHYYLNRKIAEMQYLGHFLGNNTYNITNSIHYRNLDLLAQLTLAVLRDSVHLFDAMIEIFSHKNVGYLVNILTGETIRGDLQDIDQQAQNESCVVPINLKTISLSELFHLVEIKPRKTEYSYSGTIRIPTMYKHNFKLVQPAAIPFSYKNKTYELALTNEYYLIRDEGPTEPTYTIPFTTAEKSECKLFAKQMLCYPRQSVQVTQEKNYRRFFIPEYVFCLSQNFIAMISDPIRCRIRDTFHTNQIKQLNETSFYIYIIQPDLVQITCNQDTAKGFINESTLVTNLDSHCNINATSFHSLENDQSTWENEQNNSSDLMEFYDIDIDLTSEDSEPNYRSHETKTTHITTEDQYTKNP